MCGLCHVYLEALASGLVSQVVPEAQLEEEVWHFKNLEQLTD